MKERAQKPKFGTKYEVIGLTRPGTNHLVLDTWAYRRGKPRERMVLNLSDISTEMETHVEFLKHLPGTIIYDMPCPSRVPPCPVELSTLLLWALGWEDKLQKGEPI